MKKLFIFMYVCLNTYLLHAQATLPTSWNFSTPGISTPPSGWTTALGTNGNLTYGFGIGDALSCRFDATGEYLQIFFSDKPGPLSYYLSPQNAGNPWGGQFDIQESADGQVWNTLRSVTYKASTSTTFNGGRYQETLASNSRYVRFYYTSKLPGGSSTNPGGNMAVDSVWIQQAPAPPTPAIGLMYGSTILVQGGTTITGNASSPQFTIKNNGTTQTLKIDSVVVTGINASDFTVSSRPDSVVALGSGILNMSFTPGSSGTRKAALAIYSNDSVRNPFIVNLYAIGGSFATEPTGVPSNITFSNIMSYGFDVTFGYTGAKPEKFIVLKQKGSAVTSVPVDGQTYRKGDYIGSAQVEKICDSIELIHPTYIISSSTYYYTVFSYNGPAGFENYLTSQSASGNVTTGGSNPGTYYNGVDPTQTDFISKLSAKINPHDTIYYSNYISRMVNPWLARDTTGGKKVVTCVYTNHQYLYDEPFQWANGSNGAVLTREHTWPQSWMPTNMGNPDWPNSPGTSKELPEYNDLHNLFPAHQINANARRSNNPFDEVVTPTYTSPTGLGILGKDSANRTAYEPKPEHKGDVARALFYMAICYNGISGKSWVLPSQQNLALLRQWHQMDPPDAYEIARHEFVYNTQGNRNPFIDHPEWAAKIDFYTLTLIQDTQVVKQPTLTIQKPAGTSIWKQGQNITVSWIAKDIDSVIVYFSEDSLKTVTTLGVFNTLPDSQVFARVNPFVGSYGQMVIKDKNSAASDTSNFFGLENATGMLYNDLPGSFVLVYPNPFSDVINIKPSNNNIVYTLNVYNELGCLIYNIKNEGELNIESNTWNSGVYFWELMAGDVIKRGKIFRK